MKNLTVFASVLMIGGAAFAGTTPRVYDYSATLNTAVAKNAKKVSFTWDDEKVTFVDICYRAQGKVTFKGLLIHGCDCVPDNQQADRYPMMLLTSSEDNYKTLYVYAWPLLDDNGGLLEDDEGEPLDEFPEWTDDNDVDWTLGCNVYGLDYYLIGNPLPWKATTAEAWFWGWFFTGNPDACGRLWDLYHQGFGKAAIIDKGDGTLELSSVSGNVLGDVTAPYCSAEQNNCPRCEEDDECAAAIGFAPCFDIEELENDVDMDQVDEDDVVDDLDNAGYLAGLWGNAYGTFSLKYNKSYSTTIKTIDEDNIAGTVEALAEKAFKKVTEIELFPSTLLTVVRPEED